MSPRATPPGGGGDLTGRQPAAVLNALAVLEEVARAGPGVTAQQISASLGLPRATAYRLLNLLVQDEYLVRLPDLSGFALGRKVALLAGLATRQDVEREAAAILAEMRGRIRGGVHLASLRSGRIEVIDEDPDFPLGDADRSALDLLLRADGDLRPGADPVPYAVCRGDGPEAPGVFGGFAAAVRDPAGALVAGVALSLPVARLGDPAALFATVADDVRRLADVLADRS